jgi:uncharacterized damage-inducible protein DinB
MAKFKSEDLLNELTEDVSRLIEAAEFFKQADKSKLVYQVDKAKWSVVQCLEHLNAYGRIYLPAIEKKMEEKTDTHIAWFNSGYWGEKFTKSMKPTNVFEIKNKMKGLKKFSFPNSLNVDTVLNEFHEQQLKLQALLKAARERDLNQNHIPITLTKLVKLRLGDAFRFLVAHEQRHMIQARNTLKQTGVTTDKFPVILLAVPQ